MVLPGDVEVFIRHDLLLLTGWTDMQNDRENTRVFVKVL